MAGLNTKYRVQEALYNNQSFLDENNFYKLRQESPDQITSKMTYLMGDYTGKLPLIGNTLGLSNKQSSKATAITGVQYSYPVIGKMNKTSTVAVSSYSAGDKPGINGSTFTVRLNDNKIKRHYRIMCAGGTELHTQYDGVPVGTGQYEYRVKLVFCPTPTSFCPLSELESGTKWISGATAVAESESRSTESSYYAPGNLKNQITFMRAGLSWAGNSAHKVINISMKNSNGEQSSMWMEDFLWQFEMDCAWQQEYNCLYGKYNRAYDGTIGLKDDLTGKPIPTGSGLIEQTINKGTYTALTYDNLTNRVGNALYGQSDTDGMNITLYTGTGGIREFDKMATTRFGVKALVEGNVADKFITGSGRDLAVGGFFNAIYHIDGYYIKVVKHPMFDHGPVAQVSGLHPISGLPKESYRMLFIDDSEQNGVPNIQYVYQEERRMKEGIVKGLTDSPKSFAFLTNATALATDVDKSIYTRLYSGGISMRRGNRCFDLRMV